VIVLLQIFFWFRQCKKLENWTIFDEVIRHTKSVPIFGPPCINSRLTLTLNDIDEINCKKNAHLAFHLCRRWRSLRRLLIWGSCRRRHCRKVVDIIPLERGCCRRRRWRYVARQHTTQCHTVRTHTTQVLASHSLQWTRVNITCSFLILYWIRLHCRRQFTSTTDFQVYRVLIWQKWQLEM